MATDSAGGVKKSIYRGLVEPGVMELEYSSEEFEQSGQISSRKMFIGLWS